jgi:hypothetical protein
MSAKVQGSRFKAQGSAPAQNLKVVAPQAEGQAGLKFIKIDDLHLIPRELLAQVRDWDWQPEEVYRAWPLFNNPFNLLYALADEAHRVRGVLWLCILPLHRTLFINLLSLAKEAQGRGFVKKQLHPFMQKLCQQLGLRNYKGITSRPDGFCRQGFKRDRMVLVEG